MRDNDGEPAPETRQLLIDGRRTVVNLYGADGSHVLLLHGIPGYRGTWAKVAPLLARSHRVIAPDLAGFGDSEEPTTPFHAAEQARMVLQLMDMLGVQRANVVGFDFGGPTALLVYRLAPARVLSLGLAATNAFTDTPVPGPLKLARVPLLGDAVFRLLFGRTGLSLMWRAATGDRAAFPFSDYRRYLASDAGVRETRAVFLASMRNLTRLYRDVEQTLGTIRVPTAVVWGDRDPFFPLAVGRRTADAIPGASFVALAGCGHFVPEERPEAFTTAVREVLAS